MNPKLFIDTEIIPLEKYPGRKAASGSWQKILAEVPKCKVFIDAMCGSGFIGSMVKGCKVLMNDIDKTTLEGIRHNGGPNIELSNQSYIEVIKRMNKGNQDTVFYFDPPYLMETRSYQAKLYRHDWSTEDHKVFLKVVKSITTPVMISHYPCDLYNKTLHKWRKITYPSMTRGGVKQEGLYLNYPQPVLLQFPELIGSDFTDRQRIQRKVTRLINKLKNEAENERAAILTTIINHFNYVKG